MLKLDTTDAEIIPAQVAVVIGLIGRLDAPNFNLKRDKLIKKQQRRGGQRDDRRSWIDRQNRADLFQDVSSLPYSLSQPDLLQSKVFSSDSRDRLVIPFRSS